MDANTSWARLDATLRERGLTGLIRYAELADVDKYQDVTDGCCPSDEAVRAHLPESFRRFVAEWRCPAIETSGLVNDGDEDEEDLEGRLDDALRFFEFLPYHSMRWATASMGHPGRQYTDVRAARESGEYRWEYTMFAAFDAADGCGWAFWPAGDESDGTGRTGEIGEPQVWYVEDSLPEEQVGTFAEWLDGMVTETLAGLASLGLVDPPERG